MFAILKTKSLRIRRFTPVSSRIATIHLETGQANNIISVYAPTQAASGETLNEFYSSLTAAIDARPPDSDLIIAGDFNSRVGIRESEKSHPVGPFGIAGANDRGLTLRTFCHIHNSAHNQYVLSSPALPVPYLDTPTIATPTYDRLYPCLPPKQIEVYRHTRLPQREKLDRPLAGHTAMHW